MRASLLLAALHLALPAAHAALYEFSYTPAFLNQTTTGQLEGTLQPDQNTVVVDSIIGSPSLAGVPGPVLPFIYSTDFRNFGTANLVPKLSIDGSFMDFYACSVAGCSAPNDGFTFNAGNVSAATFFGGAPFYGADGSFYGGSPAGFAEAFDAARWTLSASAVPEAGTLSMLLAGGLLLAGARRSAIGRGSGRR